MLNECFHSKTVIIILELDFLNSNLDQLYSLDMYIQFNQGKSPLGAWLAYTCLGYEESKLGYKAICCC